jgi:periplasmic divalent cation tolerance protein
VCEAEAEFLLVLTTVPDEAKGLEIARRLVEDRLAACVTIGGAARSIYRWKGEIADQEERVLFIKTKTALFDRLEAALKAVHPYSVPEIIAFPVVEGSEAYLKWITGETSG